MDDERIDLTPIDPTAAPPRFDAIVGRIMSRAAGTLAERRQAGTALAQIAHWWRPTLAAAAVLAVVALGTLALADTPAGAGTESGIAEAVGVPSSLAPWVRVEESPTTAELVFTPIEEAS